MKTKTVSFCVRKPLWVKAAVLCLCLCLPSCAFTGNSAEATMSAQGDSTAAPSSAAPEADDVPAALTEWQAGATVSAADIEAYGGLDKCFAADTIPEGVWQRMQGKTYQQNPYVRRADLRHIRCLHWDYDQKAHVGEMIVSKRIAGTVARILRQLYDARYPIERMRLPDDYDADDERQMLDNNTSGFCFRTVAGTGKLSKHAQGLAIDINPLYNPYCKPRADGTRLVRPATADKYCDRTKAFRYKIDKHDLCYKLFTAAGFRWGGAWKSCKDYQHFEYVGR